MGEVFGLSSELFITALEVLGGSESMKCDKSSLRRSVYTDKPGSAESGAVPPSSPMSRTLSIDFWA